MARGFAIGLIALIVLIGGSGISKAQLPEARCWSIFPPGGARGTSVEVTVTGRDLDDAEGLIVCDPRLAVEPIHSAPGDSRPDRARFRITISADAPLGYHDVAVQGAFGVSNPRVFTVGPASERIAQEPRSTPDVALSVPLGSTINARLSNRQVDHYRFSGRKGRRLDIVWDDERLDSRARCHVRVTNLLGETLAVGGPDRRVAFMPPADGDYRLLVDDVLYRGGEDFVYRFQIAEKPVIDGSMPLAVSATGSTRIRDYTLAWDSGSDALGLSSSVWVGDRDVTLASIRSQSCACSRAWQGAPGAAMGAHLPIAGASGWMPPALTEALGSASVEEDLSETPMALTLPIDLTGRFYPEGDEDFYEFSAAKGERFRIDLYCDRLGGRSLPQIVVQSVETASPAGDAGESPRVRDLKTLVAADRSSFGVEFGTPSRDPVGDFEAPRDGRYRLVLRDLFNVSSPDPNRLYRLLLGRATPDFELIAMPLAPPPVRNNAREVLVDTLLLRPGASHPVKVVATRRGGFDGDIRLGIQGLPDGVSCPEVALGKGEETATLMLTAADSVSSGAWPLDVSGEAIIDGETVHRAAQAWTVLWDVAEINDEAVTSRACRQGMVAVYEGEPSPLIIEVTNGPLFQTGDEDAVELTVKVRRQAAVKAALKFKIQGHKAFAKAPELDIPEGKEEGALKIDLKKLKVSPGIYDLYLETQTKFSHQVRADVVEEHRAALKELEDGLAALKDAQGGVSDDRSESGSQEPALEEIESKITDLKATLKAAEERAKPRDVTETFYSAMFRLEVAPGPGPGPGPGAEGG